MTHPCFDITKFTQIGVGGFSRVYKAQHTLDNHYYAIKVIPIEKDEHSIQAIREVRSLSSFEHPNIIRYYNCWMEENVQQTTLMDTSASNTSLTVPRKSTYALCIQTELMDMTLREYMDNTYNRTIEDNRQIFHSICKAVLYLHKKGIVHCDIKPSNILLQMSNQTNERTTPIKVKLSDFGLVNVMGQVNPQLKYYGSEFYMHPKLLESTEPIPTRETDLYALCILGFELLNPTQTRMELVKKIQCIKPRIAKQKFTFDIFRKFFPDINLTNYTEMEINENNLLNA